MDPRLLPVQVPEYPYQLRGMDSLHLSTQPLDLFQHGLTRVDEPLLGLCENGFGSGEIAD
ncbi:hypothetical protein ACFXPY_39115 [Streptomyces sp. NPDC059153]|uniref:hypothetical protein n=1 Tax=Streptomyces sp. NPDC059153 TaxID=3346743 RepID=UPI0036BADCC9